MIIEYILFLFPNFIIYLNFLSNKFFHIIYRNIDIIIIITLLIFFLIFLYHLLLYENFFINLLHLSYSYLI